MFEEVNNLIEDRLKSNWSETEIDEDNVAFTPVRGTPFIRLQIEWVDANQIASGGRDRGDGYVNITVFVPANTATTEISRMCDDLSDLFSKWSSGELKFKVARTVRVGKHETWYRRDVIVPFTYDECL